MIQHARLPVPVPLQHLQKEVASLPAIGGWQSHFNKKHYEGGWNVLSLRSPAGEDQIIPDIRGEQGFADTALMASCPSVKMLLDGLQCPLMAVRLMNLKPGAVIKEHRDHELSFEKGEARLHFPVFTNPSVEFYINGQRVPMQEGECWYINANLPHKVANNGTTDRIHLVVDCNVNDWLINLFARSEKVEVPEEKQDAGMLRVIEELRLQNTELTRKLADDLERNLSAGS